MLFSIVAVNVRGLNSLQRIYAISNWIELYKPHLFLCTETKLSVNSIIKPDRYFQRFGFNRFSNSNTSSAGVGIINHHASPFQSINILYLDSHMCITTLYNQAYTINIILVYLYNQPSLIYQLITNINAILATNPFPTVMIGDFNMPYSKFTFKYLHLLNKKLMSGEGFFSSNCISYYTRKNSSLIDLVFYSPELHFLIQPSLIPVVFSDHLALTVTIKIDMLVFEAPLLTNTTRLLLKSSAPEAILSEIYIYFNKIHILTLPPEEAWFSFINIISSTIKHYTCRNPTPTHMMKKLELLHQKIRSTPANTCSIPSILLLKQEYKQTQLVLADYLATKKAKIFLKNTHNWSRDYICWALGYTSKKLTPTSILHNSKIITAEGMIAPLLDYFKNKLQSCPRPSMTNLKLNNFKDNHNITNEEIMNKIKKYPNSAHPGIHAIPKFILEHLNYFTVPIIQKMLSHLSNQIHIIPQLYPISLVPFLKKPIHPTPLSNIRPISMSPLVIKVAEALVKDKIQPLILQKISKYQFTKKGSSIPEALFLFRAMIDQIRVNKKAAPIVVQLDIEAAFDSIPIDKLLGALEQYNIPLSLRCILANLLYNRSIHITLNGKSSVSFVPHSSIPQGLPLSALLFISYINPLLIEMEKKLPPVVLSQTNLPINHISFMDDIVVFLPSKKYIPMLIDILNKYTHDYSLKFNTGKMATWNILTGKPNDSLTKSPPHSFLGIPFHLSVGARRTAIQNQLMASITKIMNSLSRAYLSIHSKTTLINMLILPKINYYMPVVSFTKAFIRKINSLCCKLIWNKKAVSISIKNLQKHTKFNGLSLHSINTFYYQRIHNTLVKIATNFPIFQPYLKIEPTDTPPPSKNKFLNKLLQHINRNPTNNEFSTKIDYWTAHQILNKMDTQLSLNSFLNINNKAIITKYKYWNLEPKYLDFMIKINLEALPTNEFLSRKMRYAKIDPVCSICNREEETMNHFLLNCSSLTKYRQLITTISHNNRITINTLIDSFSKGFFPTIRISIYLLFTLWFIRCHFVFNPTSRKLESLFLNKLEKIKTRDRLIAPVDIVAATWSLIKL